jgi:YjjG family noncanonical pyrimidine nucleotidase
MKIKAIFCDLDNTLIDFNDAEKKTITKTLNKLNIPLTDENIKTYSSINLKYWKMYEKNEISTTELKTNRWKEFLKLFNMECDYLDLNEFYLSHLKDGYKHMPNSEKFLKEITKKYKLYIASNGNPEIQYIRIHKAGFDKYIEKVYLSKEIGYKKPEKEFFQYILNDLNLKNDEVIMIGDSMSSDIEGAINSNILPILYDPTNSIEYDGLKSDDLLKILEMVDELND